MSDQDPMDTRIATALKACRAAGLEIASSGYKTQPDAVMVAYVAGDDEGSFSIHGSMPAENYGLAWAKVQAVEELRADVWRQAMETGEPPRELLDGMLKRLHDGGLPIDMPQEDPKDDDLATGRIWVGKGEAADQEVAVIFVGPSGNPRVQRVSGAPDHALRRPFDVAIDSFRDTFEPTERFDALTMEGQ
jgi:hypothetical protein